MQNIAILRRSGCAAALVVMLAFSQAAVGETIPGRAATVEALVRTTPHHLPSTRTAECSFSSASDNPDTNRGTHPGNMVRIEDDGNLPRDDSVCWAAGVWGYGMPARIEVNYSWIDSISVERDSKLVDGGFVPGGSDLPIDTRESIQLDLDQLDYTAEDTPLPIDYHAYEADKSYPVRFGSVDTSGTVGDQSIRLSIAGNFCLAPESPAPQDGEQYTMTFTVTCDDGT